MWIKIGRGAEYRENYVEIGAVRNQCIFDPDSKTPIPQMFQAVKDHITMQITAINDKNAKYDNAGNKVMKSRIAIALSEKLDGENKDNALRFISFLAENNLAPKHMSPSAWKVNCGDERIFRIRLHDYGWTVEHMPTLFGTPQPYTPTIFDNYINDENLREFVNNKMKICDGCYLPKKCARKELSDDFNTICHVKWDNPDGDTIDNFIVITRFFLANK